MNRTIFNLTMFLLLPLMLQAQPKVETSEPFPEPDWGWNKLLQLEQGNTFFFHHKSGVGIEVRVYARDHRLVASQLVSSTLWDPKNLSGVAVKGLYEIGGQPVLFISQVRNDALHLYRVILDPNTGAVVSDQLIATLPPYGSSRSRRLTYFVEKDPRSDHYAVLSYNFQPQAGEHAQLALYAAGEGGHRLLHQADYTPEPGIRKMDFIAMSVHGDAAYLCMYGYGDTWNAGNARLILSRLGGAPETDWVHKTTSRSEDFRGTDAQMLYNPGTGLLQLLTMTQMSTKSNVLMGKTTSSYQLLLSLIDPESLTAVAVRPIYAERVSEDLRRQTGKDKYFGGSPQYMALNPDNTITLLFEEKTVITKSAYGSVASVFSTLGNIGVLMLNDRGVEQSGNLLFKYQGCNTLFDAFYLEKMRNSKWVYGNSYGYVTDNNNPFFSFDYIPTAKGKYILFNEAPENINRKTVKGPGRLVKTVSGTNTICYRLREGGADMFYLFGTPPDDKTSRFCYVASSHFRSSDNRYATLLVRKNGRSKEAVIAWTQFE